MTVFEFRFSLLSSYNLGATYILQLFLLTLSMFINASCIEWRTLFWVCFTFIAYIYGISSYWEDASWYMDFGL